MMDTRYIELDKKDIAFFQFILEGYEGLATATTIDNNRAVVKIFISPGCSSEFDKILEGLGREVYFKNVSDRGFPDQSD
jgi:hypothetical protein